jgi:hypothetical protein
MRQSQPTASLRRRAESLALVALLVACGPDDNGRDGCRLKPTFVVTIAPKTGTLPPDTRVDFEYGGGNETFQLGVTHLPEVVFCETHPTPSDTDDDMAGRAGAGGAGETVEVTDIVCKLWTGGATDVQVIAEGFEKIEDYTLRTDRKLCTVTETIELEPEKPSR